MSRVDEPAPSLSDKLLHRIDAYGKRAGLSAARISTLAVNDGDLARRLRDGGTLTVRTFEKFMKWLDGAEAQLPANEDQVEGEAA